MEGDLIKLNKWLLPLSWLYGIGVGIRNQLFELGVLKSKSYDVPVISVGNITVGGTGKTPHVEYLVKLLHEKMNVAVLSRGYKRKSHGFVLANANTQMQEIGDEPYQIKTRFPAINVAVDKDRRHGIETLMSDKCASGTDVVLLDDAYQHRYVKPGINILLVDYHRLIVFDKLLPAGRLREPKAGKSRADIVIITKCPSDLKPMEFRVLTKVMDLFPYQDLFFTELKYKNLHPVFGGQDIELKTVSKDCNILLLTGIASPKQMLNDLGYVSSNITPLTFSDHHRFTQSDIRRINETFEAMHSPKLIITTEKDAVRLAVTEGLDETVKKNTYALPIEIQFMLNQTEEFNHKILDYVQKNSRNSILAKAKNDHNPTNGNHSGDRPRTISFRNNR